MYHCDWSISGSHSGCLLYCAIIDVRHMKYLVSSLHCYGEVVLYPAGGWENWTCGVLLKRIFGQNERLLVSIMCWSSGSLTCSEEDYDCWKEKTYM